MIAPTPNAPASHHVISTGESTADALANVAKQVAKDYDQRNSNRLVEIRIPFPAGGQVVDSFQQLAVPCDKVWLAFVSGNPAPTVVILSFRPLNPPADFTNNAAPGYPFTGQFPVGFYLLGGPGSALSGWPIRFQKPVTKFYINSNKVAAGSGGEILLIATPHVEVE